jgi:hypothetical protein
MAANTLPVDLYQVMALGLGGETFQEFIDHYNEKYDKLEIDGFEFEPTRVSYTFAQIIASTGATTLPAYVDPESPGYEAALREVQGRTGNIPTLKKFYRLNRTTVREQLQLIQKLGGVSQGMEDVFMNLLDEGSEGLIKSYLNALTHQRHQIVSTGKFIIDETNNPRGLRGITINFGIKDSHFDNLTGNKRWWTKEDHTTENEGSDSDPIEYIKNRVKAIRRTYHYYGAIRLELTQDLLDDLLTHSKVLSRIGKALYPNASAENALDNARNQTDEALLAMLKKLVRVDEIVGRDSYAYVDKPGKDADGVPDLITSQVENFKKENIAFVPVGKIGGIQGVEPLDLGYKAEDIGSFHDGRLKLYQRVNQETHSLYIESEAAQLCVPSAIEQMFISTVTV